MISNEVLGSFIVFAVVLMFSMLGFSIRENCLKTIRGKHADITLMDGITFATIKHGINQDDSDGMDIYSRSDYPYILKYTYNNWMFFLFGKRKRIPNQWYPRNRYYEQKANLFAVENLYVHSSYVPVRISLSNDKGFTVKIKVYPGFVIFTACIMFVMLGSLAIFLFNR